MAMDASSKIMGAFANLTRLGTVALSPGLGARHWFRSGIMSAIYSKTGQIPFLSQALVLKDFMTNSQDYQDFIYNGGASSSWFKVEDTYLTDNKLEKSEEVAPVWGRAWNAVHSAKDAVEGFIKMTDNLSRLAEYKGSKEQGKSNLEAAFGAREVVPDYMKKGLERSVLRTGTAFIGAHINSMDRMFQEFKEDPQGALLKASALTFVSAALWYVNKDDKAIEDLPDYQKVQYWNFNVKRMFGGSDDPKDAMILRLPKLRARDYFWHGR